MTATGNLTKISSRIVSILLDEKPLKVTPLKEATVQLPRRGTRWIATFTGPAGGQVWRSTGLTDRDEALRIARRWEKEARIQREGPGCTSRTPVMRVRRSGSSGEGGLLTQKEVAMLLGISERAVRAIERRAIEKLRSHPLLRQVWQHYLIGELDEDELRLTAAETTALLSLATTPGERQLLRKVLRVTQG